MKFEKFNLALLASAAAIQYILALALFVAAILIGWSGASRFFFAAALTDAYSAYDGNRPEKVLPASDRALFWIPRSRAAMILKAKALLEQGKLEEAREIYHAIGEQGGENEEVLCGLGAIDLKKAERIEKGSPDLAAALARASESFDRAIKTNPRSLEAAVGKAYVGLINLAKGGKAPDAYAAFARIGLDNMETPTKEGLADYYFGAALSASLLRKDFANALANMNRAYHTAHREAILADIIAMEAIRCAGMTPKDLRAEEEPLKKRVSRILSDLSPRNAGEKTKASIRNLLCALAWSYASLGDEATATHYLKQIAPYTTPSDADLTFIEGVMIRVAATREALSPSERALKRRGAIDAFRKTIAAVTEKMETPPPFLAALANATALLLEEEAGSAKQPALRDEAIALLEKAVSLAPEEYLPLRNLAVVQRRAGKEEESRKSMRRALRFADKPDFAFQDDLAKLRDYFSDKEPQ